MNKKVLVMLPVLLLSLSACNSGSKTYDNWKDFNDETFVSVTGTNCEDAVKALVKNPTFIYVDDPSEMASYIRNGDAIAGVTNEPNIAFLAASYEDLDVYPTLLDTEEYGFLLSKDNELTPKINETLEEVTNSGDLAEIIDKWIYAESEPTIDVGIYKVDSQNTLTLAVDPSFEPCCYLDSKGNYAGYEIELAYLLASTLNYNLNIISMDFAELFDAVNTEDVDFATCIITISEDRKALYDLSDSFYTGGVALLMDKEITDPLQEEKYFTTLSDFSKETVATIGGASGVVDPAKEAIPDLNIKYYRSTEAALDALKGGRVSGLLRNKFNLEVYLEGEDDLMLFPEDIAKDYYGYMLCKDSQYTSQINSALLTLETNGTIDLLQSKWINADETTRIDLDSYEVSETENTQTLRYAFADGNEPFSYTIEKEEQESSDEEESGGPTIGDGEGSDTSFGAVYLSDEGETNPSVTDPDPETDSDEEEAEFYLAGYEVELMYAIAKELGMKLDVTVLPAFNDLFTTIDNNNADIVSGGISITDARKVTYDFSNQIFEGAISLAIRKDTYKA